MGKRGTLTAAEQQFMLQARIAHLATANEEGIPALVPVCFAFDGSRFFTPLDEKPKQVEVKQLQRVRNITARPEVAFLVDRYDDQDWSRLGYVLVHGHATIVQPGETFHQPAIELLRARYKQYHQMALEQAPVIMILPERITSWQVKEANK